MPWSQDPNMLSAFGSLGAVAISVLALYISHRGQSAQQLREKREELRAVLERLVALREEQNTLNKEQDEALKAAAGAYQQVKRAIYLEAAESISKNIERHVSGAEYYVLGFENELDSDFIDAKHYYKLAAKSRFSSVTKKSEIYRFLAGICFSQDPAVRNLDEGRESYRNAVQVLENRQDAYSFYTKMLAYRNWAVAELWVRNLDEAGRLLQLAGEEWEKIPAAIGIGWSADWRQVANAWTHLGTAYFQVREENGMQVEKGRWAFQQGIKILSTMFDSYGINNDYVVDAHGVLFQAWGQQEYVAGNFDDARHLLAEAEQKFKSLAAGFPWRNFRLAELKQAESRIARGEPAEAQPTPPVVPGRDRGDSERLLG